MKRKKINAIKSFIAMGLALVLSVTTVIPGFSAGGEIRLINDLNGGGTSPEAMAERDWNEDMVSVAKGAWLDAHTADDSEERTGQPASPSGLSGEAVSGNRAATASSLAKEEVSYDVFEDFDENAARSRVADLLKKAKSGEKKGSAEFLRRMLKETGIPEDGVPREDSLKKEILALEKMNDEDYEVFRNDAEYTPEPGDLIFIARHISVDTEGPATESDLAVSAETEKETVTELSENIGSETAAEAEASEEAVSDTAAEAEVSADIRIETETEPEITEEGAETAVVVLEVSEAAGTETEEEESSRGEKEKEADRKKELQRSAKNAVLAGIVIAGPEENGKKTVTFLYSTAKENVEIGTISSEDLRIVGWADMEELHDRYCGILEEEKEATEENEEDAESAEEEQLTQDLPVPEEVPLVPAIANEKTEYVWKGENLTVTASMKDPDTVPDNAELTVTRLSADTDGYNYRAYLDALGAENSVSGENAMLYDVAFLMEETDENGEKTGRTVEVQPDGEKVKISFRFTGPQLTEELGVSHAEDLQVSHLPLSEAVKENTATTREATEITADDIIPEDVDISASIGTKSGRVEFETESLSVYALYWLNSVGKNTAEDINGKSFVVGGWSGRNDIFYALTGEAPTDGRLSCARSWIRLNSVVYDGEGPEPVLLTFDKLELEDMSSADREATYGITDVIYNYSDPRGANKDLLYSVYYEKNNVKYYLHLNFENGRLYFDESTNPAVRVFTTSDFQEKVRIQSLRKEYCVNLSGGGTDGVFKAYNNNIKDSNNYLTLFEVENSGITALDDKNTAEKTSVSMLEDGQTVVLYQSVWNSILRKYDLLALDGSGDLVQVLDEGNSIGWYPLTGGDKTESSHLKWTFTVGKNADGTPSGYYWLKNTETGAYLSPRALYNYDGSKKADIILPGEGIEPGTSASFDYSIQLPGRQSGAYDSIIVVWSQTDGTEGLYYKKDDSGHIGYVLAKGVYGDADSFNFAVSGGGTGELTTVDTVDSEAMGIHMTLYDYDTRAQMNTWLGSDQMTGIQASGITRQYFVPYLLKPVLNNGVPVRKKDSTRLDNMFGEGAANRWTANHLFLESAYSETGYYEYSAGKNYAYFNKESGDFTVYDQLGAPQGTTAITRERGNFMPFSKLLEDTWPEGNLVNEFAEELSPDDPQKGAKVHKIETIRKTSEGDVYNYNFGMKIEANFLQPESLRDRNGNDIIFEFTGDDDLWVFVDGVLVLDLGGIHAPVSGSINFTSGDIDYRAFRPRSTDGKKDVDLPPSSIQACFKKAGVFPDGSEYNEAEAADYFNGNTLLGDTRGHTMTVFYLERGKNASNLRMRFNLNTVPRDSFLVAKQLGGTDKHNYTDKNFYFRAFTEGDMAFSTAKKAEYTQGGGWKKTDTAVNAIDGVTLNGNTYNHVFVLKDGEGIFFDAEAGTGYYVEEILESPNQIEKVLVNDIPITVTDGIAKTDTETTGQRRQVIFDNYFNDQELRITKKVRKTPEQMPDPDATFTFKLAMGPEEKGKDGLQNFSVMPYYLVKTENGTDTYYYRIDAKIVPLTKHADGHYYYDDDGTEREIPSKHQDDPIFDYSSQTGYIDGVPKDFTVVIKDMLPGMMFRVQETNLPKGYTLESFGDEEGPGSTFEPVDAGTEENTVYGITRANETAKVLAENEYHEGTFRLRKVSSVSPVTWLPGAKFELYGADPEYKDGEFHFYAKDLVTKFTSDREGFLVVDEGADYYGAEAGSLDLKLGTGIYYLKETAVPEGFLMENPLTAFRVNRDGSEKIIEILGLVEWDEENQRIIYNDSQGMQKTEDTEVHGLILQTGDVSNVPEAYVTLSGKKFIQGRTFLPGDSVTISIEAVTEGAPMPKQPEAVIEPAEGTEADYTLDAIHYRQDHLKGSPYTYTVKEKTCTMAGVEKDTAEYTVTVTLRNNEENKLEAAVAAVKNDGTETAADALNFTNVYTAAGIAQLQAKKTLTGRALEENQFSFELLQQTEDGTVRLEEMGNRADGAVAFTPVTYTLADAGKEYNYIIREVIPEGAADNRDGTWTLGNYTYDGHSENVKVTLEDNGDGTLKSTVTYASGAAVFANSYEEPPKYTYDVSKVIKTRGLLQPEDVSTTVYFALKGANGLIRKNGEKWILPVEVVRGVPKGSAVFRDLDSPDYEAVEVDAEGEELNTTDRYSGKMVTDTIYDGLKLVDIQRTGPEVKDGVIYFVYTNTFEADPIVEINKEVIAAEGLDKSTVNETFYFALRNGTEYLMKDGKKWIESVRIVNGVPQNRAYFQWMGETLYEPVEVDKDGNPLTPGAYGSLKLIDSSVTTTEAKNTYTVARVTNTMGPKDPEPDPPAPTPTPDPPAPTPRGGGSGRSRTYNNPSPDYTPDVLGEQREEAAPDDSVTLGALRRPGDVLGAARTGDTSAMALCGMVLLLALMLLAGWLAAALRARAPRR